MIEICLFYEKLCRKIGYTKHTNSTICSYTTKAKEGEYFTMLWSSQLRNLTPRRNCPNYRCLHSLSQQEICICIRGMDCPAQAGVWLKIKSMSRVSRHTNHENHWKIGKTLTEKAKRENHRRDIDRRAQPRE